MLTRSRAGRWPIAALAAGIVLAAGAAAGYGATRPPDHDYGAVPLARASATHPSRPAPGGPASSSGAPAPHGSRASDRTGIAATAVPVRLRIAALGVDAPVVPVGVAADGSLGIPARPSVIGWWAGGSWPGRPAGATVLVGHVDSAASGPGALFRLQAIRPGAVVTVTAGGRTWRYDVRAVRAYAKATLPSAAIFGQQVTPRLVIVTCGGPFDAATGHYLDNIMAWAVPA